MNVHWSMDRLSGRRRGESSPGPKKSRRMRRRSTLEGLESRRLLSGGPDPSRIHRDIAIVAAFGPGPGRHDPGGPSSEDPAPAIPSGPPDSSKALHDVDPPKPPAKP